MPAYAKDGKVVFFFQAADKFGEVCDDRLQRHRQPGRRRHVADLFALRANPAVERDRRAGEEGGELRTERATGPDTTVDSRRFA